MSSIASIIVTWFTLATCYEINPVTIPEANIIPKRRDGIKSTLPPAYGQRACGGPGQFLQWRVEGCDTINTLCHFPANQTIRRTEFDFIPSEDIERLGVRILIAPEGKELHQVYENPLANSSVKAGKQYTVNTAGGGDKQLLGYYLTTMLVIYRADGTNRTESCVVAEFQMV